MKNVITTWKPVGQTPYQLVQSIKQLPRYQDEKVGFAGRLDPMAEGIMVLLVGEENKNRKMYERLAKTYEFEVLFGISTDTYDLMGMPKIHSVKTISSQKLKGLAKNIIGKHNQAYPPYSYIKVNGKPLYWWARAGRLNEIKIPKKEIEIYESSSTKSYKVSFKNLFNIVKNRIQKVDGDFRQKEIVSEWQSLYAKNKDLKFNVAKFKIKCTSGTYVRAISNDFGKKLNTGALAYSITRTAVGKYCNINL